MQALIYEGPQEMAIREVDIPSAGEDEILIRVAYSGICGSELSGYLGKNSLRKPPLVFGHEFSGTIAAIGSRAEAEGRWQIGQRVTANPLVTCGQCEPCLSGRQQLCTSRKLLSAALPGSNAEYVKIPAAFVYGVPDTVTLQQAAMTEPAACAIRAAELASPKPTDTVLIIGMGPIGLLALQAVLQYGVQRVIAVDMNADRLEIAAKLGAKHTVCPASGVDTLEEVKRLTGSAGVDAAIDAVGAGLTRKQCVLACKGGGRTVFTGLHEEESALPVNIAIRNEVTMTGAFAYSALNFRTALKWIEEGRIGLSDGVVEAPLSEGGSWFETLLKQPGGVSKVLLVPGGER
ncbi:zinc-dependent alcohol dehydrogenase [Paenibacillus sacheonensis]|uniref:Alcohol dehydrogenase catalytic domain-containing protein n=1 Tax=Paenibacillus sacheonensis TaxID=742054 RepID=A0A7X4YPJ0_9BACL|nr:galactitol-1-phosphate 5-dehydrogenase [Paenibacillus sacheonensis]MBM7565038.1 2-desacetyl-2-hydroxyethyl bacteriochlorophyllide A dehydrogenase [Paenibacillus sacheonensis]NBC70177.1 alcohol dehydrogenase catalytic domain-containing protein [Paenibacillus sacheonensis]